MRHEGHLSDEVCIFLLLVIIHRGIICETRHRWHRKLRQLRRRWIGWHDVGTNVGAQPLLALIRWIEGYKLLRAARGMLVKQHSFHHALTALEARRVHRRPLSVQLLHELGRTITVRGPSRVQHTIIQVLVWLLVEDDAVRAHLHAVTITGGDEHFNIFVSIP
jgi:hypothetical protein